MTQNTSAMNTLPDAPVPPGSDAARHEMKVWAGMLISLIVLPFALQAGGLTMTSVVDCVLLAMVGLGLNLLLGHTGLV